MKLLKAMDVDTTTTDSIDAFLTIMGEGTIDEVTMVEVTVFEWQHKGLPAINTFVHPKQNFFDIIVGSRKLPILRTLRK